MKICVDPGHGMSNRTRNIFDPGAVHQEGMIRFKEAEIALRYGLGLKDVLRARGHEVFMTRDDDQDHAPVGERAGNAERAGCNAFVSLHLNDVEDETAHGLEVLFRDQSDRDLAQQMQSALVRVTGLRDRKIKVRENLAVLRFTGPAVLIELGFIANDDDRSKLLNPEMRESICRTICDVLESSLNGSRSESAFRGPETGPGDATELEMIVPPRTSVNPVPLNAEAGASFRSQELKEDKVPKDRFLQSNTGALKRMIEEVNQTLGTRYSGFQPLNQADVWVTMYTEMGLDANGLIDPGHRHSEGERGLLPLPENIRFWNGQGAPNPEQPMDLKTNVSQFLLYLGQLKNKKAGRAAGFDLYRDLFRFPGIQGEPTKEAITVASVVHGYFYSGAYQGRVTPPYEQILRGIANGERIDAIMSATNYVHAGSSILRNRAANIAAALALL